ncbi:hypothetical protein CWD63_00200 [Raoultella ornithinolytica]|nr:DUF551 domain-containing protein [Raoultella ornithinolytica]PQH29105.1 hypothetical protein CWD63_00200 [Raoultella ornithinolytica]
MTNNQLTRERIELIANFHRAMMLPPSHDEIEELARMALAAMDSEPVFTLEVSQAGYKGQKLGNHFGFITLDAARNLKEGNYQLYRHAQSAPVAPVCTCPSGDGSLRWPCPVHPGNSPVIPDGSASMLRRWLAFGRGMQNAGSQLPRNLIAETEEMLAAAPQSPGSEPAAVPGKWIPVSERMPEVGVKVLCFPVEDEPIHATFNGQLWLQDVSWSGSEEPIDNVIPVPVTHWMPLPAAPQEVKP